jgi:hypothetical protein
MIVENMNRLYTMNQSVLAPQSEQDQEIQMQKCEAFSREVLQNVVKVFIAEKLCPKIQEVVEAYTS